MTKHTGSAGHRKTAWKAILAGLIALVLGGLAAEGRSDISLSPQYSQLLAKQARLTLYNLSYNFTPVPLKDGLYCTSCIDLAWDSSNYSFNISGFSYYQTASNSHLTLTATNRINNKIVPSQVVYIEANYTNWTSPILFATCTAIFTDHDALMSYNLTRKVYETVTSYEFTGTYPVNATCSADGFETAHIQSESLVQQNVTMFTLNQSLVGMRYGPSVVVADMNNDSNSDAITMGGGSNDREIRIYYGSTLGVNASNNETLSGLTYGALSILDYDNDGIVEISIIGMGNTTDYKLYHR